MTEPGANRFQGHPGVDHLGGVHVPELVDCGGNLRCRPVLGPQLSGGGMPQRATDEGTDRRVPMAQTPVAEPPGSIYRLRVVLAGISPMIWRQLEVPDSITIAGLHEVLQVAFGWSGQHLHRFTVRGKDYGICYEGGMTFDDDPRQVRLVDLGLRERERLAYAYGFFANLECWRNDLRVQAIEAPRVRRRYPWCGGGARSAPPEEETVRIWGRSSTRVSGELRSMPRPRPGRQCG
jgi:hypothetical protein